jgi:hypothetical protein
MVTKKARTSKKRVAKKTVARATKTAVAKKAAPSLSPAAELEQTIAKSQVQLAKLYEKGAAQAQKSVDKIKGQLDKAVTRQATLRDKKNAAVEKAAANRTPASQKQVERAREALRNAGPTVSALREQIKSAKQALKDANDSLKRSAAQQKALEKFESDWAKATAPKKPRKATAKRRPRKAAARKPAAAAATTAATVESVASE